MQTGLADGVGCNNEKQENEWGFRDSQGGKTEQAVQEPGLGKGADGLFGSLDEDERALVLMPCCSEPLHEGCHPGLVTTLVSWMLPRLPS